MANTKQRHLEILGVAHELIADIDVTQAFSFRELAKELAELTDCHYDTAKRNLTKAARQKRHPDWGTDNWGGVRPGGGRPLKSDTKKTKED